MCPLLFSTSPLPQRLEGFTDTIGHIFKKAGDCRAFWCKCEPKTSYEVFELHISAGGVCTRSLAWTGVWCSSSSELVPLKHSLLKWQGAWKGVLMHSGGWLWLTSFSFSLCLPKFVHYLQWWAMEIISATRGLASATTTGQWWSFTVILVTPSPMTTNTSPASMESGSPPTKSTVSKQVREQQWHILL